MTGEKWFRPKRFGYGATPSNWKGWAFMGAFILVVLTVFWGLVHLGVPRWVAGLVVLALAGAIIPFTKAKTDGEWRWRWR